MNPSKIHRRLLCLAGLLLSSIACFSQEAAPAPPPAVAPAPAASLPTDRTLKSTDGRTITVTILEKTPTGIMAKLNGKTLNIALSTLSADDQAFIASCKAPVPIGKKILYVINYIKPVDFANVELLKKDGFDVTIAYTGDERHRGGHKTNNPASTDASNLDTVKDFDIYWFANPGHPGKEGGVASDGTETDGQKLLIATLKMGRTVMVNSVAGRPYKSYMGTPSPLYGGEKPVYVKTEKNLISYNNQFSNKDVDPAILPKVIEEMKKVVISNHR